MSHGREAGEDVHHGALPQLLTFHQTLYLLAESIVELRHTPEIKPPSMRSMEPVM
jgi:hypothetical protein